VSLGEEMTIRLSDSLARRTRLALTDRGAGIGPGSRVPELVATAGGWSWEQTRAEVDGHLTDVEWERGVSIGAAAERP
jgi:hypothetical protein